MSPASDSLSRSAGTTRWKTPILVTIFGGLVIFSVIIAIALLFLACYYRVSAQEVSREKEEKSMDSVDIPAAVAPEIVVILAGDEQPTLIAKPCTSSRTRS